MLVQSILTRGQLLALAFFFLLLTGTAAFAQSGLSWSLGETADTEWGSQEDTSSGAGWSLDEPADAKLDQQHNSRNLYEAVGSLVSKGEADEAIRLLDEWVASEPEFQESYYGRAYWLIELGEFERAITDLDSALRINPSYADALSERAFAHTELGNYEQAWRDVERALEIAPGHGNALNIRGFLQARTGQTEAAQTDIAASDADLNDAAARGLSLQFAGRPVEAAEAYTEALMERPKDVQALSGRGVSLYIAGLVELAVEDFDAVISIEPENILALAFRSISASAMGDIAQAESDAFKALELAPFDDHALSARARLEFAKGNYRLARSWFEKAIRARPEDAHLRVWFSSVLRRLNDFETAQEQINRAHELGMTNYAQLEQSFLLAAAGQSEKGFEQLLHLTRKHGATFVSLLQTEWFDSGHYQGIVDGLMGPATRQAFVQCATDPNCPRPTFFRPTMKPGADRLASRLVGSDESYSVSLFTNLDPHFAVKRPGGWTHENKGWGVVFTDSNSLAQCAVQWQDLDASFTGLPTALVSRNVATQLHTNWASTYQTRSGTVPKVLNEQEFSANGLPVVEFIDDLNGGQSIKWYLTYGLIAFEIDCETYTPLFADKRKQFDDFLYSFDPT